MIRTPLVQTGCFLIAMAALLVGAKSATAADVPDTFQVKFETTKGDFIVEAHREWAPQGVDRFHALVESGFFNDAGFFRVVPGFMVQFGINGDPEVQKKWREAPIKDDPVTKSNTRGMVTFATAGPNTRTSQLFINYRDNSFLDKQGFAPFGQVIKGMEVVDKINSEYREQPNQGQIQTRGNEYLKKQFPRLDFIKKATIIKPESE